MMNLEIMRRLVAEDEAGADTITTAQRALAHWGSGEGRLEPIRYSANATYRFELESIPRILRLTHAEQRTRLQIEAELEFIAYLAGSGIPAAQAIPAKSGKFVTTIETESARFFACVFECAPGEQFSEPDDLSVVQLSAWGKAMALLHRSSEVYRPNLVAPRPSWQRVMDTVAGWIPAEERQAQAHLRQAWDWLAGLPAEKGDYGLIHWDLCIDNLSWDGRQFHIFDFDDAAYFWYAADLAFALEDVLAQPEGQRQLVLGPFLDGYRSIRPEIEPWLETLPGFLQVMNTFKFGRVLHALQSADPALDPPWLARLRQKLTRRLEEWRQGFRQPFDAGLPVK